MKNIDEIFLHYSATYADQDIGAAELKRMHLARGWSNIGYHWVIRLNGTVEQGRPENQIGAGVRGHNVNSIHICCVGGLRRETGPDKGFDTRTPAQKKALIRLIREIQARHPGAVVLGHRDVAATQCPGYDAQAWWAKVNGQDPSVNLGVNDEGPSVNPVVTHPMLKVGDIGQSVIEAQKMLHSHGLLDAKADGIFGPKTAQAVREFQHWRKIDVDGIIGPMTWAELYKVEKKQRSLWSWLWGLLTGEKQ